MPPKLKKPKSKPVKLTTPCTVKRCKNIMVCNWSVKVDGENSVHSVCDKHLHKHHDKNDKFNFYDEFNIPYPSESGGLDRFGFPVAPDEMEIRARLKAATKENNSNSIERLREWKEKNKDKKYLKKFKPGKIVKPRSTVSTIKTKKITQTDMDDILSSILS